MTKHLTLFLIALLMSCIANAGPFPRSTFDNLDYCLYWFGADSQYEKSGINTVNGSRFYDPAKPTLIYIHGWAKDSSAQLLREDFNNTRNGRPDQDFAAMWRNHGYNIGILYWNQFSDEAEVKDAEAKIWSATGRKGMRWRDSSRTYHQSNLRVNVSEMLYTNLRAGLAEFHGPELRLAGHSLGNQVAINISHLALQDSYSGLISHNLVPDRLTLLDPFYSKYAKDYLNGRWNSGVAKDMVVNLKNAGVAIDAYRSSATNNTPFAGDSANALLNQVAFVEVGSKFFYWWDFGPKHISATWLYLWSMDFPVPPISNADFVGVSAKTSNTVVRDWMYSNRRIYQSHGRYSKTPSDNRYTTKGRL